ncbi:MAG: YjbQ family protein [Nitrospirae bacterium]|nr:MAG: YjbQ family protein [Nitrospirota bacterium]
MLRQITLKSSRRREFIDITRKVQDVIESSGVTEGICVVYVPHTTAGVTINEGADPSVKEDILMMLEKLVPHRASYAHMEGNSDAHIQATLVGSSVTLLISSGRAQLGTWQSLFFCEFDGPRTRKVLVKITGD